MNQTATATYGRGSVLRFINPISQSIDQHVGQRLALWRRPTPPKGGGLSLSANLVANRLVVPRGQALGAPVACTVRAPFAT